MPIGFSVGPTSKRIRLRERRIYETLEDECDRVRAIDDRCHAVVGSDAIDHRIVGSRRDRTGDDNARADCGTGAIELVRGADRHRAYGLREF